MTDGRVLRVLGGVTCTLFGIQAILFLAKLAGLADPSVINTISIYVLVPFLCSLLAYLGLGGYDLVVQPGPSRQGRRTAVSAMIGRAGLVFFGMGWGTNMVEAFVEPNSLPPWADFVAWAAMIGFSVCFLAYVASKAIEDRRSRK